MTLLKIITTSLFTLAMILILIAFLVNKKSDLQMEKLSPFECGFISKTNAWSPFSMHFFLSALIFLIFDVELILLFPYLLTMNWKSGWMLFIFSFMFIAFLTVGVFLEWSNKFLEWTN